MSYHYPVLTQNVAWDNVESWQSSYHFWVLLPHMSIYNVLPKAISCYLPTKLVWRVLRTMNIYMLTNILCFWVIALQSEREDDDEEDSLS